MPAPNSIFISYRRSDSQDMTGRIYDSLEAHFGRSVVFMDIDSMPYGVHFQKYLNSTVGQCKVLLAIIGESWLHTMQVRSHDGGRDWVKEEIELALRSGIPIIPLLIGDTRLPKKEQLPQQLHDLMYFNAAQVRSGRDFRNDMRRLISALESIVGISVSASRKPAYSNQTPVNASYSASLPKRRVEGYNTTRGHDSVHRDTRYSSSTNFLDKDGSEIPIKIAEPSSKSKNSKIQTWKGNSTPWVLILILSTLGLGIGAIAGGGGLGNLIAWALMGLVSGGIARTIYPGRNELGIIGTISLGIVGSFVGGFIYALLGGSFGFAASFSIISVIMAVLGAIVTLFIYYAVTKRTA